MGTPMSRSSTPSNNNSNNRDAARLLKEKDSKIRKLEKEIKSLKKEKESLQTKIEQLEKKLDSHDDVAAFLENSAPEKVKKPERVKDLNDRNLPQIGDHVVSMWSSSQWQYFTATVRSFDKTDLRYLIDWDDNDPTGRTVDYYNLALDKVPSVQDVGVGSTVLFHQGQYSSTQIQGVNRSGGLRWHQGIIDKVTTTTDGTKIYDGRHTKTDQDGKWITYKGYSYQFTGYTIEDFRLPPNVFDVLSMDDDDDSSSDDDDDEHYDVYISYSKINSPSAIKNKEVSEDLPPSYEEAVLDSICDPRKIASNLREKGVKVVMIEEEEYLKIVTTLKKSKIFIACLSDEYASNNRCRMEFQYAKKTLKIPVIPIVVGTDSFQWQMTVVGLLIAGDLYIHFKNKQVEEAKMTELCRALQNFLPKLKISDVQHLATGEGRMELQNDPNKSITGKPAVQGKSEMFFSYCWSNSYDAFKRKEVSNLTGNRWSDPRVILKKLSKSSGMKSWMDVDRLRGADEMGLFGQIATGMGEAKIVISCVSSEYADSDNCRMEIQFAVKSLNKPTIALIVGDSDAWKSTSVGKMVQQELTYFNLQKITDESKLNSKIKEITKAIRDKVGDKANYIPPSLNDERVFKAPVYGDHVVCLHQHWAYFMATITAFDESSMSYTVNWDDGDPSGRVQSYQDVALDVIPTSENEIGLGTIVLFPQGSYAGTVGNNTGGIRYHQGKITNIYKDSSDVTRYDGVHTKNENDEKWVSYRGYDEKFENLQLDDLRLSPNAMDALMACRQAFQLEE